MFVQDYMTKDPVYISPDDNFPQTMNLLRKRKIRHLPVVENGRLVGILVEADLLTNQPSPATTLSLYEIYSLLETLHMRQIMTKPVITVQGDCPLEEAARIMVEKRISCLPVMDGDKLVGIITETDVFRALVEVLGGDAQGCRFTIRLPDKIGKLAEISGRVASTGGNIVAVTSASIHPGGPREIIVIKESGADAETLIKQLEQDHELEIVDVRASYRYEPRLFG